MMLLHGYRISQAHLTEKDEAN